MLLFRQIPMLLHRLFTSAAVEPWRRSDKNRPARIGVGGLLVTARRESTYIRCAVSEQPARPLLIYDGGCSFCRRWVERWRMLTGDAIEYEPSQTAAGRYPEIPQETFW